MPPREFKRPKQELAKENKAIGKRLRAARDAAHMSQRRVAAELGENQSWVSKVEQGERRADLAEGARMMKLYKAEPNAILMPEGLPANLITTSGTLMDRAADSPSRKRPKGARTHRPKYRGPAARSKGRRRPPRKKG